MPLTDLIRYFNVADSSGDSTLYPEGRRVGAWHRGLRLASRFRPIVDVQREMIVGHQAILDARRDDGSPIGPLAAYELCASADEVVHFDRLCRTLHALNFLAQQQHTGGYLQLAVHPRHLLAVQNQHGLVYEAILKRCGLGPADLVLQLAEPRAAGLEQALDNYRQRGYRIALKPGNSLADVRAALALQPEIIKLDTPPDQPLRELAQRAGVAIELGGIANVRELAAARRDGIDLGNGPLFGEAAPDCRPTHDRRRIAYNVASPHGVHDEYRQ